MWLTSIRCDVGHADWVSTGPTKRLLSNLPNWACSDYNKINGPITYIVHQKNIKISNKLHMVFNDLHCQKHYDLCTPHWTSGKWVQGHIQQAWACKPDWTKVSFPHFQNTWTHWPFGHYHDRIQFHLLKKSKCLVYSKSLHIFKLFYIKCHACDNCKACYFFD